MKWLSLLLLFVLGLTACSTTDESRPATIVSKEKMVLIMADIHLAEGIISSREYSKDSSLLLFTELENQTLVKYGVSQKEFKETYNWYTSHVEEYKELYRVVVDTLNVRTSEGKIQ